MNARAQITLEQTYDGAAIWNICNGNVNQLMIVKFEASGEQYVKINRCGKLISVYKMNHTLVKNISLTGLPVNPPNVVGDILYLSENLFDMDSGMEFMYLSDSGNFFTTKILSYANGQAKVFSLSGTLSTAIDDSNEELLIGSNLLSNPYPNPANSTIRVDYTLPKGVHKGEIVFYDLQGKEIKRFNVNKTFDHLLISISDISAGTYYYQLQTAVQHSEGKKIVVIR